MGPEIEVEISDTQGYLRVEPAALVQLVRVVLAAEGRSHASISIALVDNWAIHALNRTHLGHDWPTDVISFPLSAPDDPVLTGELVVSAEMACTSAREIGVDPRDEVALYVVHGVLHLCGFDDHDDSDRRRMREREDELLAQAGLTNPYPREGEALSEPVRAFSSPGASPSQLKPAARLREGEAVSEPTIAARLRAGEAPPGEPDQHAAGSRPFTHELEGQPWTG